MRSPPAAVLKDSSLPVSGRSVTEPLSESVQWQLIATVYRQTTFLRIGGVVLVVVTLVGWARTHQTWFLIWAGSIVLVLFARLELDRAFGRRRERPDRVRVWRNRFIVGSWAMGALWGVGALAVTMSVDAPIRMLLVWTQTVIIMGAMIRNSGCPPAAYGQIVFGLTPLLLACLLKGDRDDLTAGVFVLFEMFAAFSMVRHMYGQTLRFLKTDERNRALVSEVQRANCQLAHANSRLEAVATTDALTGIANRRRFDDVLGEEVRRAQREGAELSLLMLDIDTFKGYNDRYGHQAGDNCLRRVAEALAGALRRPADLVARYGGEEFVAILPWTNAPAASALAEDIRTGIEALAIPSAASEGGAITVSIGVSTFIPNDDVRPEDIIRAADEALYRAKDSGRNCVRSAQPLRGRQQASGPLVIEPLGTD